MFNPRLEQIQMASSFYRWEHIREPDWRMGLTGSYGILWDD